MLKTGLLSAEMKFRLAKYSLSICSMREPAEEHLQVRQWRESRALSDAPTPPPVVSSVLLKR